MPSLRDMINKSNAVKAEPVVPVKPPIISETPKVEEGLTAVPIIAPQLEPHPPTSEPAPVGNSVMNRLRSQIAAKKPVIISEPKLASEIPNDMGKQLEAYEQVVKALPSLTSTLPTEGPVADLEKMRANLKYLAENIEQKDLVGQVIRTIAVQLKSNPAIGDGMVDSDFDLIVRGLRKAYMVAARKKTETRGKAIAKTKEVDEISAMFKDAGINLDF